MHFKKQKTKRYPLPSPAPRLQKKALFFNTYHFYKEYRAKILAFDIWSSRSLILAIRDFFFYYLLITTIHCELHICIFLDLISDWKQILLLWIKSDMQLGHGCWYRGKICLPPLRARVCYMGTIAKRVM